MTLRIWIIALAMTAAPAMAADDKPKSPVERTTNDRQILDTLTEIHDRGAALFDTGDAGGCYRLFQGGLLGVRMLLPKEYQKDIDDGLADAGRLPAMSQRALLLHRLIEDTRKKLRVTAGPKIKSSPLGAPRPVGTGAAIPEPLPPTNPDKAARIDAPVSPPVLPVKSPNKDPKDTPAPVTTAPPNDPPLGPPVVPVKTPVKDSKTGPAPVTTAPPSDDPTPGPKLPFTPIIPKTDGK